MNLFIQMNQFIRVICSWMKHHGSFCEWNLMQTLPFPLLSNAVFELLFIWTSIWARLVVCSCLIRCILVKTVRTRLKLPMFPNKIFCKNNNYVRNNYKFCWLALENLLFFFFYQMYWWSFVFCGYIQYFECGRKWKGGYQDNIWWNCIWANIKLSWLSL